MAYFKINGVDFSNCVNELKVNTVNNYNAQVNASGNTVVDFINSKREVEVGIIPLDDVAMKNLQAQIAKFSVNVSFRNPKTNLLEENVKCIIPGNNIEYYTIQAGNVSYKAFSLTFSEL